MSRKQTIDFPILNSAQDEKSILKNVFLLDFHIVEHVLVSKHSFFPVGGGRKGLTVGFVQVRIALKE